MGSSAAKNAAKTQADSAKEALAVQQQMYQQQRQDFQPYQQAGTGAVGRLTERAGQAYPQFQPGGTASLGNPSGMPQQAAQGVPRGTIAPSGMPGQGQGPMSPQGAPQGPQMVLMQGPDGSRRPVPANVAQQLTQRGFRVIG
jgi:hypothetical protein